jgi:PKD repeat protein
MRKAVLSFVLPGLFAGASVAKAQGPEIGHNRVGCIVVGQFPKMAACFRPPGSVARGRVYFKPEAALDWYYVEMKSDAPCYAGVLPRPTEKLINTRVLYYIHVVDRSFAEAQTAQYDPIVVEKESDCKDRLLMAPFSRSGPQSVFPSVPQGFAVGSRVLPVVLGVGGAAIVGGGVAIGVSGKDKAPPTPPPTPIPTPTPPPTPIPTPTPTPPVESPLSVTCQAQPRSGYAPLTVAFSTFPSGGTGTYEFLWDFGDGGSATRSNPNHTYIATGTFTAVVKVTSGRQEASCSRTIAVSIAPPSSFPLSVAKAGSGVGTVTSSPAGISCGGACSTSFTPGTVVTLSQSASPGSVFGGWSGACTGMAACSVTMDAAKSVTATFNVSADESLPIRAPVSSPERQGLASAGPDIVHFTIDLQVAGGRGQVAVNGQATLAAGPGVTRASMALRRGENRLEAWLTEGRAAGLWRFELGGVVEPGSLAVLAGEVQLATSDSVVFRIRGAASERLVFTFRRRGRVPEGER